MRFKCLGENKLIELGTSEAMVSVWCPYTTLENFPIRGKSNHGKHRSGALVELRYSSKKL